MTPENKERVGSALLYLVIVLSACSIVQGIWTHFFHEAFWANLAWLVPAVMFFDLLILGQRSVPSLKTLRCTLANFISPDSAPAALAMPVYCPFQPPLGPDADLREFLSEMHNAHGIAEQKKGLYVAGFNHAVATMFRRLKGILDERSDSREQYTLPPSLGIKLVPKPAQDDPHFRLRELQYFMANPTRTVKRPPNFREGWDHLAAQAINNIDKIIAEEDAVRGLVPEIFEAEVVEDVADDAPICDEDFTPLLEDMADIRAYQPGGSVHNEGYDACLDYFMPKLRAILDERKRKQKAGHVKLAAAIAEPDQEEVDRDLLFTAFDTVRMGLHLGSAHVLAAQAGTEQVDGKFYTVDVTFGTGTKRSRNSDTFNPLSELEQLRDRVAETLEEI